MASDATRAERLQELFLSAVQIANPQERANFLRSQCGDHSSLLREVESLVAADQVKDSFLEQPCQPKTEPPVVAVHRDLLPAGQEKSPTEPQGPLPRIPGYEVLRELGRGGMGVVYLARHLALKRLVALKMILAGVSAGRHLIARACAEAEAVARLQHPNIVQIHEIGDQGGVPFLALEFVDGGSLDRQLSSKTQNPRAAAELVLTLAQAMHAAHRAGIIHRDLKPTNILLTKDGLPKITDFGLAKHLDSSAGPTQSGVIMGTPSYMAPEQAAGKTRAMGPATDIYALGAILYEMLTGRPPFKAETPMDTVMQVIEEEPVSVARLQPNVPRDLETICLKCLQKEPKKRYATAEDLAEDLGRYLRGEPIRARPVGKPERVWRWCRRNPLVASLVMAVAFSLIVGISVSLLYALRANEQAKLADLKGEEAQEQAKLAKRTALQLRFDAAVRQSEANQALSLLTTAELLCDPIASVDRRLEQSLRLHLGSWFQEMHRLKYLLPHGAGVRVVAFSPDGKIALTGSGDRTVRFWNTATGEPLGNPLEHAGNIWAVVFSPDGKTVLTGSEDKTARLWDAATGEPRGKPLTHDEAVRSVAYSPDGRTVLTGSDDKNARLWEADTGKLLGSLSHDNPFVAVAFSPDGRLVLTGGPRKTAQLWDAATRKPLGEPFKHKDGVRTAVIGPDSKTLLTGGEDDAAQLWDVATRKQLGPPLQHQNWVVAVAFSPDGKIVLTGSGDRTARLWETATGKPIGPPLQHAHQVVAVAFSPDGKTVLTGSHDHTARLWEIATAKSLQPPLNYPDTVLVMAFSPDGTMVLTGSNDKTARLWDVATGKQLGHPLKDNGTITAVIFGPDGKIVATGSDDKTARLWDAATGEALEPLLLHEASIVRMRFSRDGRTLLTMSEDESARLWEARLWDVLTRKQLGEPMPHGYEILTADFSPDDKFVLTGCGDHFARLWKTCEDRPREPLLKVQHNSYVPAVAFSPDGKTTLTGSWDATARLWDSLRGHELGVFFQHQDYVQALAFSPDGKAVLTGSWDTTARLWDVSTGDLRVPPLRHHAKVWRVDFSPDGKTVLTRCKDGTAWLWDAATGKPLGVPLRHQGEILAASFTQDGKYVVTGGSDKLTRRWRVPRPIEGDADRIRLWAHVITGLELDKDGGTRVLDGATWQARRQRLRELGNPPWKDE